MTVTIRHADRAELADIVRLLADDPLGRARERYESPLPAAYERAFDAIDADPNNELVVACCDGTLAGVLQLTFLPNLTYCGRWRAQIEGVRVARAFRSRGVGRRLFGWAIDRARERDCHLVQLTTDRTRPEARAFYAALGFTASHDGLKLHLGGSGRRSDGGARHE